MMAMPSIRVWLGTGFAGFQRVRCLALIVEHRENFRMAGARPRKTSKYSHCKYAKPFYCGLPDVVFCEKYYARDTGQTREGGA